MAELSDAEVFGSSTPQEMSDAEVFGAPPTVLPSTTPVVSPTKAPQQLSDGEVGLSNPGITDYLGEIGKRFVRDAANTAVTLPLKGAAAQNPTDTGLEAAITQLQQGKDLADVVANVKANPPPLRPVQQEPGWQAAQVFQTGVESLVPDRNILNPVVSDIAGGFGSVAGNIATSMIPGIRATTIPSLILQGGGQQAEDAIQKGATEEQIRRASQLGNISGATEFADLLLPQLGTTGKTLGLIRRVGLRTLEGAFIEGGQEGLQQFIQNIIAKGVYNPKQDLTEDVAYNALIGAIVGGSTGAVMPGHGTNEAPTAATIDQSVAPPQPPENLLNPVTSTPEAPTVVPPPELTSPSAPVTPTATPTSITTPTATPASQLSLPLESPPITSEVRANSIPPDIVDHIQKSAPPLELPSKPASLTLDMLVHPTDILREDIQTSPGANTARLAKLLGPKLYGDPSNITEVSVKEMFQNAFDAVKGVLEKGQSDAGNIDISLDPKTRTVAVTDDGSGMTPDVLGKQFLEIAGTKKESKRASGGLGIAKMLFIFGNKNLRVTTLRDNKVSTLNTTGEQLFSALDDKSKAPNIQIRSATSQDLRMFPKGHGTRVEVTVPTNYVDPATGETKTIDFESDPYYHKVLQRSPLFDNITVTANGQPLNLGTNFPLEDFTQFANVNFDWGTARIYVTKTPSSRYTYGSNGHVLSNGLWQFSLGIKKDPSEAFGENIAHQVYIDVNPRVAPEDSGYPFDLNRQQFSPQARKSFENIFKYIGLLYRQAGMQEEAANFGSMQLLDYDPATKSVKAAPPVKIEPKSPPPPNAVTLIHPGDKVRVVDGQLIVNGRKVPELTPQELEQFKINPDELRVDQSEIDPKRVILHDNVDVIVSSVERRSITDYGREKFGKRFDEYVFSIGNAFKELRDNVVKYMPNSMTQADTLPPLGLSEEALKAWTANRPKTGVNGYEDLAKEGIGVSFDQEYRGVSIRVPFSGMFINPAVPEYNDPLRAAVGMVGTMVHELAHYKVRSHDAAFPAEMQRLLIMLDTNPHFNFHAFKQKVVNIVAAYEDVFTHLNGVFTSGDFIIQSRGKRFEDARSEQTGDGSVSQNTSGFGSEPESGSRLSDWVAKSQTIPTSESGRRGATFETGPSRANRPSDNGRARNYSALRDIDAGITAPPQQPEIDPLRQGTTTVMGGVTPPQIREASAHADRMNWLYKYFAGLTELLDGNPNFAPLRKYVERVRAMHSDETRIHDAAVRIMKDWRSLGEQSKNLERLILDVQNMPYLSPQERKQNMWRHPNAQEFAALVQKHGVSNEALQIYNRIRQMDETFLRLIEQNAVEQAQRRITDPVKLADRLDEIRSYGVLARAQPFFPFTRFGRYYVSVKDAAGKIIHFETFEPKRFVGVPIKRAEKYQQARAKQIQRTAPNGSIIETGVLPETAEPLIGMPTLLLQQMQGENIGLTPEQITSIQRLQKMRNPALAFKDRSVFGDPKVPGYSLDLQRSFARYYFHGGRYYAKVRHAWGLRGNIAEAQLSPGNKAGLIASYMGDHLQNAVLDARGDFGYFKGAIFLWAMGYVPAAATQNLTQTPMITLPFLGAKFGDVKATSAILRAMSQLTSFYRRGAYDNMTNFELQALSYGIKTGRISETQAPELAGIASGGNLITGQGGNKLQRAAVAFQEKAAFMFEMAEQFNRRVAYRAALKLALENPKTKFIDESVKKYQDEYKSLVAEFGGNESQARAVVAAIHSVDQTQFVYARYARPRFMRGPLASTLFVFKRYMQSTLFMLGNNKSDVLPRYMVVAMLMGGLGGVPGYDDMTGIFRAFSRWFFGKDVSVDRIVRQYIMQWFNGSVEPDLVLHGLARRGFGLPGLIDLLGSPITGNPGRGLTSQHSKNIPYPILDRSRALSMGNILPVDIGKMMEPTNDLNRTISDQTVKASGAVFSVGFNLYKSLMDTKMAVTDAKRWEPAMPRALGSVSRAYRAFSEGRERAKGGPNSAPTIVPYDIRDTEQMMEAIALAGGYQPLRQQAKWDSIMAKAEVTAFYDFTRKGLLDQYFEASRGQNPNEIAKVREAIIQFNKGLPDYAKGKAITADTVRQSTMARTRTLQAREAGTTVQKTNVGISRYVDTLFPESVVDVRRVR